MQSGGSRRLEEEDLDSDSCGPCVAPWSRCVEGGGMARYERMTVCPKTQEVSIPNNFEEELGDLRKHHLGVRHRYWKLVHLDKFNI